MKYEHEYHVEYLMNDLSLSGVGWVYNDTGMIKSFGAAAPGSNTVTLHYSPLNAVALGERETVVYHDQVNLWVNDGKQSAFVRGNGFTADDKEADVFLFTPIPDTEDTFSLVQLNVDKRGALGLVSGQLNFEPYSVKPPFAALLFKDDVGGVKKNGSPSNGCDVNTWVIIGLLLLAAVFYTESK